MDKDLTFTLINRNWLNSRFGALDEAKGYLSHEPIYGLDAGHTEGGHTRRILRLHDVLAMLRHVGVGKGDTVLDVGGAEGYLSHLMQQHLHVRATSFDLSVQACARARGLFGVDAIAGNASLLPFASQSFDVVVMTEVVEHLIDPISAILECQRVARRLVVLSTEEWEETGVDRVEKLAHREIAGHMERNVLCAEDLPALFGNRRTLMASQRFPYEGAEALEGEHRTPNTRSRRELLYDMATTPGLTFPGGTILAVFLRDETPLPDATFSPAPCHADLLDALVAGAVSGPWFPKASEPPPLSADARNALACPMCRGQLSDVLRCGACGFAAESVEPPDLFAYRSPPENIEHHAKEHGIAGSRLTALHHLDGLFQLPLAAVTAWTEEDLASDAWAKNSVLAQPDRSYLTLTADPNFCSPHLGIPLKSIAACEVELDVLPEGDDLIEVFFLLDTEMSFTEPMRAHQSGRVGRSMIVRFAIPPHVRRGGEHLMRLRLDPTIRSGATLRVHRVELLMERSTGAPSAIIH